MADPSPQSRADAAQAMRYVLLMGSNANKAEQQLAAAARSITAISHAPLVLGPSLRSAAREGAHVPTYLNQAVEAAFALSPAMLKSALREIEAALGRQRPLPASGICALDIDVALIYQISDMHWHVLDEKAVKPDYAQRALAPWLWT